jgi:hypothetical protein
MQIIRTRGRRRLPARLSAAEREERKREAEEIKEETAMTARLKDHEDDAKEVA